MTLRRVQTAVSPAPLWRDDPNYPGIPAAPLLAKSTARAVVTYDDYVVRYARRQAVFAALAVTAKDTIEVPDGEIADYGVWIKLAVARQRRIETEG